MSDKAKNPISQWKSSIAKESIKDSIKRQAERGCFGGSGTFFPNPEQDRKEAEDLKRSMLLFSTFNP